MVTPRPVSDSRVNQWFAHGDHAPGNTGGVLVYDTLIPAVMIVLARREQRFSAIGRTAVPALA
ncbi:DUF6790 family protein [Streptomyces sp. NPDC050548]|uniref:DUF6790 family protein n=1 Tax=Streptomyces sp. NPDC050548 TaxID=3365629 RepID=UPI00379AD95D